VVRNFQKSDAVGAGSNTSAHLFYVAQKSSPR